MRNGHGTQAAEGAAQRESLAGRLAYSRAGHDKGALYMIIKEETDAVYVADGRLRSVQKPKRKNKRHIQPVLQGVPEEPRRRLLAGESLRDEEVKYAIRQYEEGQGI